MGEEYDSHVSAIKMPKYKKKYQFKYIFRGDAQKRSISQHVLTHIIKYLQKLIYIVWLLKYIESVQSNMAIWIFGFMLPYISIIKP